MPFELITFAIFATVALGIMGVIGGMGDDGGVTSAPPPRPTVVDPCPYEQIEKFIEGDFSIAEIVKYCPEKSGDPDKLKLAAHTGNWAAAYKLGQMYEHGLEVRYDEPMAFAWYTYAFRQKGTDQTSEALERVKQGMDQRELAEGRQRYATLVRETPSEKQQSQGQVNRPAVVVMPPVIMGSPIYSGRYGSRRSAWNFRVAPNARVRVYGR